MTPPLNDREQLLDEKHQAEMLQYVTTTLEQAELAGAGCAKFCMTFLDTMEGQGLLSDDVLRLLSAALHGGYGR